MVFRRKIRLVAVVASNKKFEATIEVCKSYVVPVWAESMAEATEKAARMAQYGGVEQIEEGDVEDHEVNLVGVSRFSKRMMYQ